MKSGTLIETARNGLISKDLSRSTVASSFGIIQGGDVANQWAGNSGDRESAYTYLRRNVTFWKGHLLANGDY